MRRASFRAHQDVADALVAEQRVIDRQYRAAGIAEDEFDPLPHQALDQNICAAALFAHDCVLFKCTCTTKSRPGTALGPYRVASPLAQDRLSGNGVALGDRKYHVKSYWRNNISK